MFTVGAVRPCLDHDMHHANSNNVHYISGGAASSTPTSRASSRGGDHVGVLLDLDAGWMCLYRSAGYTEGVMGPLVRAERWLMLAKHWRRVQWRRRALCR